MQKRHMLRRHMLLSAQLSTPRFQHQYPYHPSPHTNDNYTVPPVEPNYTNRPSPAPSNAGNVADLTQMLVTPK